MCDVILCFFFLLLTSLLKATNVDSVYLFCLDVKQYFIESWNITASAPCCVETHLILAQLQPASHMYRFACSHRGAAHLSQSFSFSIWPLFSSSRAAGGCHWFKDAPAADEGWACFSFAFLTRIFPNTLCGLKAPSSCCSLFAMMQLLWKRSIWQLIWRFLLLLWMCAPRFLAGPYCNSSTAQASLCCRSLEV